MDSALITLAIQELPNVIAAFASLFKSRNPGVPVPTSEEIIAAYQSAYLSSVGKDELWLAQNSSDVNLDVHLDA